MRKVFSVFGIVKNNWKKSLFATLALSYGVNYSNIVYNNTQLMKKYCVEVSKLGDITVHPGDKPYRVVVILNLKANKSNALAEYEQYCSPLLHLSGTQVSVLLTNNESEMRSLIESISLDVDALIIAGGNGTISETLTALMRRVNNISSLSNLPIGVIPLGKTNSLAKKLYSTSSVVSQNDFINASSRVRLIAEATFAAVNNRTESIDVMKIENIEDEKYKPAYGLNDVTWGSFRDAYATFDKYRYFVKFRSYLSYMFRSYNRDKPVIANITYYTPCTGCKYCCLVRSDLNHVSGINSLSVSKKWWQIWISPSNRGVASPVNFDTIDNPSCKCIKRTIETINLTVAPSNYNKSCIMTSIGPSKMSYIEFVKEGWKMLRNDGYQNVQDYFYARDLIIEPLIEKKENEPSFFSIDGEEYDTAKIRITLLNNAINIFCSPMTI